MSVRLQAIEVGIGAFRLGPVDVEVPAGSVTALVGPNGSGKTTLLRAVAGLQRVSGGTVAVDGTSVHGMRHAERAARVAFVAQRPAVPAAMRVREVVQLGRLRLVSDGDAVQRAMQATGVDAMQQAWMEHLSEGQRHRVAVARALAQRNPALRMLAVDEPTASLDPAWAASLARLLRALAGEGVSVFVATHDFAFAAACCTHAVLLDGGRVVGAGAFAAVMQPEALAGVFGVPFARVQGVCQQPVTLPVW